MAISSSKVVVNAEECRRAGVTEFNNFGVAVSFGVVVADLGVVEGDDLFKMVFLVERLILDLFLLLLFVMVCILYFLVIMLIVCDGFVTFLLVFWTF